MDTINLYGLAAPYNIDWQPPLCLILRLLLHFRQDGILSPFKPHTGLPWCPKAMWKLPVA